MSEEKMNKENNISGNTEKDDELDTSQVSDEQEVNNETEAADEIEESELEKAQNEAKSANDKYLRLYAEFDNFRKRTLTEKAGMYDNGVRDTIERLLPVIDNLERAVNASPDKEDPMYKGVEMILKQLNEIFDSMKIVEISEAGVPFDPNIHNAVMHIEDETLDDNVVAEVLQKGYSYHDKIIRPAMIKAAN